MTVKLLTEQHLELVSLKGGCTGSSETTLVKIPHCWKSHVAAHILSSFVRIVMIYYMLTTYLHYKVIQRLLI